MLSRGDSAAQRGKAAAKRHNAQENRRDSDRRWRDRNRRCSRQNTGQDDRWKPRKGDGWRGWRHKEDDGGKVHYQKTYPHHAGLVSQDGEREKVNAHDKREREKNDDDRYQT